MGAFPPPPKPAVALPAIKSFGFANTAPTAKLSNDPQLIDSPRVADF